jgi:hypothetical protein
VTINIIICNQQLSVNQLNFILEELDPNTKIVCSTHAFFEREIESLSESARANCTFYNIADFFSDQELWDIDESALKSVKEKCPFSGKAGLNKFKAEMIEKKSVKLYEKLLEKFGSIELFVVDGLGVSAEWWEGVGARKIDVATTKKTLLSSVDKYLKKIVGTWFASSSWREVFCQNHHFVLFSKITRISNKLIANSKPVPFWKRLIILLSYKHIFPYKKNVIPACTLHELSRFNIPMLIFQDGHLPSNYSAGHLWEYEDCYSFVPSNPFAEKWLKECGRKTVLVKEFCDPIMKEVQPLYFDINKVLIVLGHAGDWSALINRSDTSRLVCGVKKIVNSFHNFKFRIRLHPTMSHPEHDGDNSDLRILDEINSWGASNLEISSGVLANDFEWANFIVSEYSQVLIDSWAIGKLGVSINLTKRRSFMQDYNELGFINADSIESLNEILNTPLRVLLKQQNNAVGIFNGKIINWKH